MRLANPKAFVPLMSDTIIIRNLRRDSVDTLKINGSVVTGNPYQATSGDAAACAQFSVSVLSAALITPQAVIQGSIIEADPLGQWPELTIQRIYKQGGLTMFDCSAQEQGIR